MALVHNAKRGQSGFVLISSYILMAGLLTAVFSYFSRSFYDFDLAQRRLGRLQALYTAESGAERALDWIKAAPPTTLQPDCGQASPDTVTPYSNASLGGEGAYTVRITKDCNDPNRIYWIRSTGTFDGITREVRIGVSFTNLANYALASDHMDPDTYFHSAAVHGPLHLNGPIQIWGWPTFAGRVTSSASELVFYNDYNNQDGHTALPPPEEGLGDGDSYDVYPIWQGAPPYPLLNQPRILFPPADVSSLDRAGVQKITWKMWIEFNRDITYPGTYNYSYSGPITDSNPGTRADLPPSGTTMLFSAATGDQPAVVIGGILDRDLTIASPQDIGIDGSLRYKCYQTPDLNNCGQTDPKLTVVSAKNIVNLPNARSGENHRGNYRILNGAFIALGGGMTVDRYAAEPAALEVWGSVVEHEIQPKLAVAEHEVGDPSSRPSFEGEFRDVLIIHDPRLDLASLPASMKHAMSVISWEACDGTCS